MLPRTVTDSILTIGPSPDMKGGIAQVLSVYFSEIFESPKFIAETVDGNKVHRVLTSAMVTLRLPLMLSADSDIKTVHLHTASEVSFKRSVLYARIARLMGRNVVYHIHGAKFREYAMSNYDFVQGNLAKATRVVVLSQTWRDFFVGTLGLSNVTVIPNIIAKPRLNKTCSTVSTRVEALFLGQLGERKGIYDLLEAIHANADDLRGKFMLHIGGNGEVDKVVHTIKDGNLYDLVKFHGWVSGNDKIDLLNRCSVYILPSYAEGLPISVLEAMSYRQAVISTPVGGIPEVVDHTNGILVEPGDVDALAAALKQLVASPEMIVTMGANSETKAAKHLSDAVGDELMSLYTNIHLDK